MLSFIDLLVKSKKPFFDVPRVVLSFDPGETCGWAMFLNGDLETCGQIKIETSSGKITAGDLWKLVETYQPDQVVIEDYRIYSNKLEMHNWSALYTPRLIGYIEAVCWRFCVPYSLQLASSKQFCSDEKLKEWGFYQRAERHSRDAIRHGCYWLLFHGKRGI